MPRRVDLNAAKFSIASGKTMVETARALGVTPKSVRRALRHAGVAPRTRTAQRDVADERLAGTWRRIGRAGWPDRATFIAWAKDNGYRVGLVLERKNRSRPWSPRNARWVTRSAAAKKAQVGVDTTAPRGDPIDWKRVRRLYATRDIAATARAVGASYHGVLRGLRKRGWLRPNETPVAALEHGTALYRVWMKIQSRCTTPTDRDYPNIGAKGIRVIWPAFRPFHAWALDAGYEPGLVLVRVDRSRSYGPKNCRWMAASEASAFKRALTISHKPRRTLTAFGETKGLVAWTRDPRCSVTLAGLRDRLDRHLPPELAITKPNVGSGARKGTRLITAFGMTQSLSAWERDRRAKVSASSISERLKAGWTAEDAIATKAMAR